MKTKLFSPIIYLSVFLFSATLFAQKNTHKFKENFKVNKDVVVELDATSTDIDVTTWNRNEVQVEGIIEIEGLTKKETEKYFKNQKFEALGNSMKVTINSKGANNFINSYKMNDVVFIETPDVSNIVIPDIEIPEIHFENFAINIDSIDFDFDKFSKDGKHYFYKWKDEVKEYKIKSKQDWEKFKKSKEYKKFKKEVEAQNKELKKSLKETKIRIKEINTDEIKKSIEKAKKEIKNIDFEKIKKEAIESYKKAQLSFEKSRKFHENFGKYHYSFSTDKIGPEVKINGKKVKIIKKLIIKVPKYATFSLNTRHCKVSLPKSKTSGKVSYGAFNSSGVYDGYLKINSAPLIIKDIQSSRIILNNVTDGKITSVTKSNIYSKSGNLVFSSLNSGTEIEHQYGNLTINKIPKEASKILVNLHYSDGVILIGDQLNNYEVITKSPYWSGKAQEIVIDKKGNKAQLNGNFTLVNNKKGVTIQGKNSEVSIQ